MSALVGSSFCCYGKLVCQVLFMDIVRHGAVKLSLASTGRKIENEENPKD